MSKAPYCDRHDSWDCADCRDEAEEHAIGLERQRPRAARLLGRRDVAAYLLDRADQYETDSPCWIGLAEAARNIMRGEVEAAKRNGEFDKALYARVDVMAGGPQAAASLKTRRKPQKK